ncbi:MAG: DUF937 domain-containing protein [Bacteroidia bacterium]
MSINLLEMAGGLFNSGLVKQVSGMLGESESNTQSAVSSMIPALLGGIVNKASDKQGAEGIMGMLDSFNLDGSMLSNIGGMLGGDSNSGLMNMGGSLLSGLFGDKVGGIAELIGSASGISKSSSSSLLSMGLPMIMSLLGKQRKEKGLDASGLMGLLGDQKGFLKNANLPAGLGSLMGIGNMLGGAGDAVKGAAGAAGNVASEAVSAGKSGIGKFLPWIIGIVALLAVLYFLRGCGDTGVTALDKAKDAVNEGTATAVDVAKDAGNTVKEGAEAAIGTLTALTLPTGEAIEAEVGGFSDKLLKFLGAGEGEANITFDKVTFKTGSATLTEESGMQLANLAKLLEAYPDRNILITGHTDNTGDHDGNAVLSQNRADAVKIFLSETLGIDGGRIETLGRGSDEPVADNATEEGRAKNRRIDLMVQ